MGKRREARERRKDEAQAEGARLALAKDAAQALGLPWPERPIPSKYTRKGREAHKAITDLAKVRMQMLDEAPPSAAATAAPARR